MIPLFAFVQSDWFEALKTLTVGRSGMISGPANSHPTGRQSSTGSVLIYCTWIVPLLAFVKSDWFEASKTLPVGRFGMTSGPANTPGMGHGFSQYYFRHSDHSLPSLDVLWPDPSVTLRVVSSLVFLIGFTRATRFIMSRDPAVGLLRSRDWQEPSCSRHLDWSNTFFCWKKLRCLTTISNNKYKIPGREEG